MDEIQLAIDAGRSAILTTLIVSAPPLLTGLIVGLIISILQAATQVQEQTLSFIPKIIAMLISLFIFLPFLVTMMLEFTNRIFEHIATVAG